jgi:hypothetical protein
MIVGGPTEWHWRWDAYVAAMCGAAAAGVVLLDNRFPGNVPVAVTALAGIVMCELVFGRRVIRGDKFDWRTPLFLAMVIGLWVVALSASSVAVAAVPAIYPLVFASLQLPAALVVTTLVNFVPLSLALLVYGSSWPDLPLAIAFTLLGVVAAPVIGITIMTSLKQRTKLATLVTELAATRAESARLSRRLAPPQSGSDWRARYTTRSHKDSPASSRSRRLWNRNWTPTPKRPGGTSN